MPGLAGELAPGRFHLHPHGSGVKIDRQLFLAALGHIFPQGRPEFHNGKREMFQIAAPLDNRINPWLAQRGLDLQMRLHEGLLKDKLSAIRLQRSATIGVRVAGW